MSTWRLVLSVGILALSGGLGCGGQRESALKRMPASAEVQSFVARPAPAGANPSEAAKRQESRLNFATSKHAVVNREMNLQVQIHRGEAPFREWTWSEAARDRVEHAPEGDVLSLLRYVKLELANAGDFKITPLDNLAEPKDLAQQDLLTWNFIVVPLKEGECRLWIKVLTGSAKDPCTSAWDTVKVYKVKVVPDESWIKRAQHAVEEMTGLMKAVSALLAAVASVLGYLGFKHLRKRRAKAKQGTAKKP